MKFIPPSPSFLEGVYGYPISGRGYGYHRTKEKKLKKKIISLNKNNGIEY